MLLDAGADVTAHDRTGNTILHFALTMLLLVDGEEWEAILLNFKTLLEAGADVTAVNN
jgi:ankyrin repeat protein